MRKLLFLSVVTATLCVPAVSAAARPTPGQLATQTCKQIRSANKQLFRQTYHRFAGCLLAQKANAKQDLTNAAKTCKAQRDNPTQFAADHNMTFNQYYGKNAGSGKGAGANAFGKCVSVNAKLNAQTNAANTIAAAKTCRAIKADAATFQAAYGTGKNAFGKCVAAQSKSTTP